jgi:ABC-type microcin C transport system permease subunit YejB
VAMVGLLVGLVFVLVIVARKTPGSGIDQLGWKTAQQVSDQREASDVEDVQSMVAARNERRRARGLHEETLEEIELRVSADLREQERRREAYLAERDLDELLEATNARRRSKGLPERTRDDARREFGFDHKA